MSNTTIYLSAVAIVGLDLANHVFQVHAVDAAGRVVTTRALRRKDVLAFFEALPCCLIGLEACGSSHHWARKLLKLRYDVRLMPPAYVKAYVRRQKNDAAYSSHLRAGDAPFHAFCVGAIGREPGGAHAP